MAGLATTQEQQRGLSLVPGYFSLVNYVILALRRENPENENDLNITFQPTARFGGKAESSLRLSLNFNVFTGVENRGRATMETNFFGRKHENSGGGKMRNASGHQSEHDRQ